MYVYYSYSPLNIASYLSIASTYCMWMLMLVKLIQGGCMGKEGTLP